MTKERTVWQPIETAPKDGAVVDLWVVWPAIEGEPADAKRMADAFWDAEEGDWHSRGFTLGQYLAKPYATHWMPLPEPPTESTALSGKT